MAKFQTYLQPITKNKKNTITETLGWQYLPRIAFIELPSQNQANMQQIANPKTSETQSVGLRTIKLRR